MLNNLGREPGEFESSPSSASDYVILSKLFTFLSPCFHVCEAGMKTCALAS